MAEALFKFREDLVISNYPIRYIPRDKADNEISLLNGAIFFGDTSKVIEHAKADFLEYLNVGFGVNNTNSNPIKITLKLTQNGLEDVCDYKGRIVDVNEDGIFIYAYDDRGAAQAIYDLEDWMTSKKQPYIDKGISKNKNFCWIWGDWTVFQNY